jgi:aminopeptidase N
MPARPELVNFDAEKMLLASVVRIQSRQEWVYQFMHAPLYEDRYEALSFLRKTAMQDGQEVSLDGLFGAADGFGELVVNKALSDTFWAIRQIAIEETFNYSDSSFNLLRPKIELMATNDPRSTVRAAAIRALANFKNETTMQLLIKATADSSYLVVTTALRALTEVAPGYALQVAHRLSDTKNSTLLNGIAGVLASSGSSEDAAFFSRAVEIVEDDFRVDIIGYFAEYLKRMPADVVVGSIRKLEEIYVKYTDEETRRPVMNTLLLLWAANTEKIAAHDPKNTMPGETGKLENEHHLLLLKMLDEELQNSISRLKALN